MINFITNNFWLIMAVFAVITTVTWILIVNKNVSELKLWVEFEQARFERILESHGMKEEYLKCLEEDKKKKKFHIFKKEVSTDGSL